MAEINNKKKPVMNQNPKQTRQTNKDVKKPTKKTGTEKSKTALNFGSQIKANLWPMTDNFGDFLEYRLSKEKENEITFELLFRIYSAIYLDLSINALSENLTNFGNGYRFWNDELVTEKGELVTENSSDTNILIALVKLLKDNKRKVDILVLKYIERIKGNEEPSVKEFLEDLKRIYSEAKKPEWKQYLISKKNLIFEDGRCQAPLKDVVIEYVFFTQQRTNAKIIKETFFKRNKDKNGLIQKFSDTQCENAAREANVKWELSEAQKQEKKRTPLILPH
jgi:hypothetical protein